jgi:hypothetical protein
MANIAQKYLTPLSFLSSSEYQALPEADKPRAIEMFKYSNPAEAPFNEAMSSFLKETAYNQTPEGRQKILEMQLAFDEARGKRMQDFRLINESIANLGKAAYSAFGGGRLPYGYVAEGIGNIGNAGLAGLQAARIPAPLVGQKYF